MATANALNVEDFDPAEWNIGREGREWRGEEFDKRIYQAPEKIEFKGGIFIYERKTYGSSDAAGESWNR